MQDARAQLRARHGTVGLVVVREEVLERRHSPPVHGVVSAQAARVRGGEFGGEVRVLGEALLVPAPPGVTQRVDDRGPDVKAHGRVRRVLGAQLRADDRADPGEQVGVPGRGEANGLGEDRRGAEPGDAVQHFGAGVERSEPEPVDAGRALVEQCDLLGEGEEREQVARAHLQRLRRIAVGGLGWLDVDVRHRSFLVVVRKGGRGTGRTIARIRCPVILEPIRRFWRPCV